MEGQPVAALGGRLLGRNRRSMAEMLPLPAVAVKVVAAYGVTRINLSSPASRSIVC